MRKFLCIFLVLVICSSFFVFSVSAESTGTVHFVYTQNDGNHLIDLSREYATSQYSISNPISEFYLYMPFVLSETDTFDNNTVVASGSLNIDVFNDISDFDYTTFFPSVLGYNLNFDSWSMFRPVDLEDEYDFDRGHLSYSSAASDSYIQIDFVEEESQLNIVLNFVFLVNVTSIRNFAMKFETPDIKNQFRVHCSNFKCISIDAPSTAVEDAINSLNTSATSGLGNVQTAVNALSTLTQSNFASTEQLLNSLDSAITDLKGSVTDSVYNALDEWHQHELDFVESDMNPIVQGVVDDINNLYDYDTLYNAFNSVVNMVTGGNTRAAPTTRLRIPAGIVTVGGNTYRFWEETYVDFGPIFENSMIQLLLVPFRFLLAYGFLRYCMYWINKLINTITLHIKVGDY